LAGQVLSFLTEHFLQSTSPAITDCVRASLKEQHMAKLASLIKDMDHTKLTDGKWLASLFLLLFFSLSYSFPSLIPLSSSNPPSYL
jgi:hypothetical protein